MPIFQRYFEGLAGLVPALYRKMPQVVVDEDDGTTTSKNILNLAQVLPMQFLDACAEALVEYIETDWPLVTAAGWVLDDHWGPYHDLQRNGMTDTDYRLYIRAKRLLNRSWGSADQALTIFRLLLPTSTLSFTPWYPKAWDITITGVDMATAAPAVNFMRKKPSPQGGGFSVCGDNGTAIIVDPECFNYSSVYGVIGVDYVVTGWFGSVYGVGGGAQAGYAHVAAI
jgi:hypothetical protein